jgi:hypothetical protein
VKLAQSAQKATLVWLVPSGQPVSRDHKGHPVRRVIRVQSGQPVHKGHPVIRGQPVLPVK